MAYIIDPNDSTKVIDTSSNPTISPQELEDTITQFRARVKEAQYIVDNLTPQIADIEAQLTAIYVDVPAVKPVEN